MYNKMKTKSPFRKTIMKEIDNDFDGYVNVYPLDFASIFSGSSHNNYMERFFVENCSDNGCFSSSDPILKHYINLYEISKSNHFFECYYFMIHQANIFDYFDIKPAFEFYFSNKENFDCFRDFNLYSLISIKPDNAFTFALKFGFSEELAELFVNILQQEINAMKKRDFPDNSAFFFDCGFEGTDLYTLFDEDIFNEEEVEDLFSFFDVPYEEENLDFDTLLKEIENYLEGRGYARILTFRN